MKKLLLGILCTTLVFAVGCGKEKGSAETKTTENPTETEKPAETEKQEEPMQEDDSLFLYEDEVCRFEITDAIPEAKDGYQIDFVIENKNTEYEINFCMEEYTMQGYTVGSLAEYLFSNQMGTKGGTITVAAGERKELTVFVDQAELDDMGITSVDEIDFNLRAWNWDIIEEDLVYQHCVVLPTGLAAEEVVYPERKQYEGEKLLIDEDKVLVVLSGMETDEEGTPVFQYYIESRMEQQATFEIQNTVINENVESTYSYICYLNGNKRTYISFAPNKEISADDVKQVQQELHIYSESQEYIYDIQFQF